MNPTLAVAQKIGLVESAAEFFRRRSAGVSADALREILAKAPDIEPEPWDRIPADYKR